MTVRALEESKCAIGHKISDDADSGMLNFLLDRNFRGL
jgi:hypothetical protein